MRTRGCVGEDPKVAWGCMHCMSCLPGICEGSHQRTKVVSLGSTRNVFVRIDILCSSIDTKM